MQDLGLRADLITGQAFITLLSATGLDLERTQVAKQAIQGTGRAYLTPTTLTKKQVEKKQGRTDNNSAGKAENNAPGKNSYRAGRILRLGRVGRADHDPV